MTKYSKYLNEAGELEGQDKRTADAVLTALENDVAHDTYKRITQHISGKAPKQSHLEAKQQLLADILSLPCLQDDNSWKMNSEPPFCSNCGKKMKSVEFDEPEGDDWTKNEFRAELRQALTVYFMGGDVGVDPPAFADFEGALIPPTLPTPTENTDIDLVEVVKQAMYDTVNSPTHEVDHFDIGREFKLGNVQNELAHRIAGRLKAAIEQKLTEARMEHSIGILDNVIMLGKDLGYSKEELVSACIKQRDALQASKEGK